MNIETANKMTAEVCGVDIVEAHEDGCFKVEESWNHKSTYQHTSQQWTIEDARCREVVRKEFKLDTVSCHDGEGVFSWSAISNSGLECQAPTIAEAEIACILSICESMEK